MDMAVQVIVLTNNRVIVAKHVDIIEENVKLVGFGDNDEINENNDEIILPSTSTLGESRGRENDLENQNKNIENNEYENNVPSSSKDNFSTEKVIKKEKPCNYRPPSSHKKFSVFLIF